MDELGICFLSFDRARYGESDPNPKRSVNSEAMDIEQLADQQEIGSKFYLIEASTDRYSLWSCPNYIPHRQHNPLASMPKCKLISSSETLLQLANYVNEI